jgi:cobalamin biosynthesis protein CobT
VDECTKTETEAEEHCNEDTDHTKANPHGTEANGHNAKAEEHGDNAEEQSEAEEHDIAGSEADEHTKAAEEVALTPEVSKTREKEYILANTKYRCKKKISRRAALLSHLGSKHLKRHCNYKLLHKKKVL